MPIPPGQAIVWHDGASLWAATAGKTEPVADVDVVSRLWVSPSARRVAYLVADRSGWELWIADLEADAGQASRKLLDQQAFAHVTPVVQGAPADAEIIPWYLAWAPDDGSVVFTLNEEWDAVFGSGQRDDLWWMDATGGPPRELLPPHQGGPAVYSPDGTLLALTHPRSVETDGQETHNSVVVVLDLGTALSGDPTPTELLEVPLFASESDWTVYHGLRWSPSGQSIDLAVGPAADHSGWAWLDGPVALVRAGLDGTSRTLAEAGPESIPWTQFPNGYWAADGSQVAWLASESTSTHAVQSPYPPPAPTAREPSTSAGDSCYAPRDLIIADANGEHSAIVAQVPHAILLWSPDGRVLAFQPYWHDRMGRVHFDAWRLAEPNQPPAIRSDLSPKIASWIGQNQMLVSERQPYDSEGRSLPPARLLLTDLDGRWRELTARAENWATAPAIGVLGD